MMDHMKSRNSMVRGEDPIKSKKLETTPTKNLSYLREGEEEDRQGRNIYANLDKEFKDKYEKGLVQREIGQLRQREAALGGSKKVTKKIQRRAKFKKALDNTIMFLGSN